MSRKYASEEGGLLVAWCGFGGSIRVVNFSFKDLEFEDCKEFSIGSPLVF